MARGVARRTELGGKIAGLSQQEAPDVQAYNQARAEGRTMDALKIIATNPVELPAALAATSLPSSLPSLAGGVVGSLIAGPLGAAAGVFGGSAATEYAAAVNDTLNLRGVDTNNQQASCS
jgi:hypothetical protein